MALKSISIYGRTPIKQKRLLFAAACVAEVFPGPKDKLEPKRVIFSKAARYGSQQSECPFENAEALRVYIRNKWQTIRYMLPREHDLVPVYVNGTAWGDGGGYRKGDLKHARKQLVRDAKITDGVVRAANDFAEATISVFPQVEATRRTLTTREITRR